MFGSGGPYLGTDSRNDDCRAHVKLLQRLANSFITDDGIALF